MILMEEEMERNFTLYFCFSSFSFTMSVKHSCFDLIIDQGISEFSFLAYRMRSNGMDGSIINSHDNFKASWRIPARFTGEKT